MDFDRLFAVLPKEPSKWCTEDVTVWLHFVHLPALSGIFCMLPL